MRSNTWTVAKIKAKNYRSPEIGLKTVCIDTTLERQRRETCLGFERSGGDCPRTSLSEENTSVLMSIENCVPQSMDCDDVYLIVRSTKGQNKKKKL